MIDRRGSAVGPRFPSPAARDAVVMVHDFMPPGVNAYSEPEAFLRVAQWLPFIARVAATEVSGERFRPELLPRERALWRDFCFGLHSSGSRVGGTISTLGANNIKLYVSGDLSKEYGRFAHRLGEIYKLPEEQLLDTVRPHFTVRERVFNGLHNLARR